MDSTAGYSKTPLPKKLGLKPGFVARIVHAPRNYRSLIGELAAGITFTENATLPIDFIHCFTNSLSELEALLPELKRQLKKDGTIWVSWYKKAAGKPTELNENLVRDAALGAGLVDVKVCAVDDLWSGLKLVYRLKDR